jgi:hypothetical protein
MKKLLIFSSIGDDHNKYKQWKQKDKEKADIGEHDCDFTLVLVYRGSDISRREEIKNHCDIFFELPSNKWEALLLLEQQLEYDYIFMLDEDICISFSDICKMFKYVTNNNIKASAPAYSIRGQIPHGNHVMLASKFDMNGKSFTAYAKYLDSGALLLQRGAEMTAFLKLFNKHKHMIHEKAVGYLIAAAYATEAEPLILLYFITVLKPLPIATGDSNKYIAVRDDVIEYKTWEHNYISYAKEHSLPHPL